MEKKLVCHRNWIGHEINESLMYHADDVFDREIYCRKLHLITEPLISECCKCQCYEGAMQGKGHECVWEDVTEEQYDVPHKDRYQEYERVDKLIKMGMLKRLVCYDANDWIYEESPDGRNRFLLGKRGQKTLICCGLNPSIATPECKCQYKNVGKVENNNVCFCYSSAACVSIRDRTSLMRYDGPFMEIIVE